jgi:hypothetical protein
MSQHRAAANSHGTSHVRNGTGKLINPSHF